MKHYSSLFQFFLFFILQSIVIGFDTNANKEDQTSGGYILTCSTDDCQTAISYCVDSFKCLGAYQCKRCMNNYSQCNTSCTNDLFNQNDYVTVKEAKYLPCDDTSAKQAKACELHCRGLYFRYSECILLDVYPVCKCSALSLSHSTTSASVLSTIIIRTHLSHITLTGHTNSVYALVVLKNGDLASGGDDKSILIWDASTYQKKANLTGHTGLVWCLAVLSNGDLVSGSSDFSIIIWDTLRQTLKRTLSSHASAVTRLAVLNNGYLASASLDSTIKIWDPNSGSLIRTLTGHSGQVFSLAVLSNGFLASGDNTGEIRIWNSSTEALIKQIDQGYFIWAMSVGVGTNLISSDNTTIKIWNTTDGTLNRTIDAHTSTIRALAVFPSGDLASAGDDKLIKIWNPFDWTLKRILDGHSDSIYSLAVMNNGLLASASWDKTVRIWDA
jgi:WD40 repeat protein